MKTHKEETFNSIRLAVTRWKKPFFALGIILLCFSTYYTHLPYTSNVGLEQNFISKSSPTIAGFYHFSTMNKPWRNIVNEQMLLAFASGLIDASLNIYVTGLGRIELNRTIYDIFRNQKFIYEYDNKTDLYEFPTLKKLEQFCASHNKAFVWYAHSKGASHVNDSVSIWRAVLNTFVLDRWRLCYDLLSSTNYTTCSAILTFDSVREAEWNTYYAGNMWWAKCSHVNRLTRIEKLNQNDRYLAELYVTSEPDVGHFNCFHTNPNAISQFDKHMVNCAVNQPMWRVR